MTAPDLPPITRAVPTYGYSELGNAERLVRDHGDDLLYAYAWKKWLVWSGARWAPDTGGEVRRRAKEVVRALANELDQSTDPKELLKHIARSETRKGIEAMIDLAADQVPIAPEQLDADPWLLNATNGTVNLQTGELERHRRDDLLTKQVPVAYNPDATAPTWEAFVEQILPDAGVRAFVQRAIGYSITGVIRDHVLLLLHGAGANGKSTLLLVVLRLLGDYAAKARQDLLMSGRRGGGSANPDVAGLKGVRFVTAIETGEGRRLDEVTVKELTGGDPITARYLYGNPFSFMPTHTVWLATNHKPEVRGTDLAIWRRLHLVPFDVAIPKVEQVKDLADRIIATEAEGVLAWMVRGCLDWQRHGLAAPDAITRATSEYQQEMDVLAKFLAEECILSEDAWVKSKDLHVAYRDWCKSVGEEPLSQKALAPRLKQRGLVSKRSDPSGAYCWHGIGLRNGGLLGD